MKVNDKHLKSPTAKIHNVSIFNVKLTGNVHLIVSN